MTHPTPAPHKEGRIPPRHEWTGLPAPAFVIELVLASNIDAAAGSCA
jgi:hypothetical protein